MACLDEDSVLAFVEGSLDEAERTRIQGHLVGCGPCADLVASSAGGAPEMLARQSLGDALSNAGGLGRGVTVGRYIILELIGKGGMGEVYAAYDPRLERRIALKLLHPRTGSAAATRVAQERLLREAQSIARLSHPNVVVVHDAGAIDDDIHGVRVFLAMEFVEGQTLAGWLAGGPRSWRAIRDVFVAAGEGLAAAHEAGLVHRDFKPQNVMVGQDGGVRVMDFGLAADASELAAGDSTGLDLARSEMQPTAQTVALTGTGVLLGTPLYMAPEQFAARATEPRTDQFSFCVALYEALYGARPFRSESLQTLISAVVAGQVNDPPQKARVPTFLRKILMRGLQPLPAARFPSMRELIAALCAYPARRRRSVAMAAAMTIAALVAIMGAERVATRGQRMCRGATDKLAGIWELDDGGHRRVAVHNAVLATGRSFAEETWTRVSALLDDYGRHWTDAYTDACEATHVRGDQSAEVLDLRMSCFEGERTSLRALTDLLSQVDGSTLVGAVDAAHALPLIERCSDIAALRAAVPLPESPAARTRIAGLEKHLAEAKALSDTGQWVTARRQVGPLVEAARTVGYEPLLAETLNLRTWLEAELGDSVTSVKTAEEAVWVALAAHRDDIATECAGYLVVANGSALGRWEESERWEALARALLRRMGPGHDRIAAWFHQDRGVVLQRRGDYASAFVEIELGLSLKRKSLPPNHPDLARSLRELALLDIELDKGGPALVAVEQALAIDRAAYGSNGPHLWDSMDDRGEVLEFLHRYPEAERDLRSSIDLAVTFVGTDHPWTAYPLTALGKTLVAEGKYREAASVLEKALRIRERAEPNAELVAETRFALAQADWALNRDRPGALALATAARDAYRQLPGHKKRAAEVDAWLADK